MRKLATATEAEQKLGRPPYTWGRDDWRLVAGWVSGLVDLWPRVEAARKDARKVVSIGAPKPGHVCIYLDGATEEQILHTLQQLEPIAPLHVQLNVDALALTPPYGD